MTLWINSHISKPNTSFPFEMRSNAWDERIFQPTSMSMRKKCLLKYDFHRETCSTYQSQEWTKSREKIFNSTSSYVTHIFKKRKLNACCKEKSCRLNLLIYENLLPFRDLIWIWILIRNIDFHFGISKCIRFLFKHLVYDESWWLSLVLLLCYSLRHYSIDSCCCASI